MPSKSKLANGAASPEVIPISEIFVDPANTRIHDERNRQMIRSSLERFGAGRSIVLDGKNVVRAGNGTVVEAREAGFDEVLIVEPKANQLVAVRRPDWVPSEATGYSILDNRTTDTSRNDNDALLATIQALKQEDIPSEALGFTEQELAVMLHASSSAPAGEVVTDPQAEWEGMPEFEGEDQKPVAQLTVYFGSEADKEAFGHLISQELSTQTKWVWHPPRATPKGLRYDEE